RRRSVTSSRSGSLRAPLVFSTRLEIMFMCNCKFHRPHIGGPSHRMNGSRTARATHAPGPPPLSVALAALALLLLTLVAPAAAGPADDDWAPDLGDCQDLQVAAGNKVALHVFGVGVQIYHWNGTSWIFVAPEAVLFADAGDHGLVGIHFGGPTWESVDGSKVVGTVIESCTPDPDAIPWLLL